MKDQAPLLPSTPWCRGRRRSVPGASEPYLPRRSKAHSARFLERHSEPGELTFITADGSEGVIRSDLTVHYDGDEATTASIEATIERTETEAMSIDERLSSVMVALFAEHEVTDIWQLPDDPPDGGTVRNR